MIRSRSIDKPRETPKNETQEQMDEEGSRIYDHQVVIRLFKYVTPYKSLVIFSFIGIVIYTGTTVAIPQLIRLSISNHIETGDLTGLNRLVLLFFAVLILQYFVNYGHQIALSLISQRALFQLRYDIFSHLQRLSMSFHNRHKVGAVMSRAQNDVHQIQEFLSILVVSLADLLSLIGIVIIMFVVSPLLAAITLSSTPLLIATIGIWQKFARRSFLNVRVAISRVNSALQENLSGVRIVQGMNRQKTNLQQFDSLNNAHLQSNIRAASFSASLMPVIELFTALGLAAIVVFGGQLTLNGSVDVAILVAFSLWVQRFYDPIRSLTMQFTQLQRAMASGARIFDLLDLKPELENQPASPDLPLITGAIQYQDVSFYYNEGNPVLNNVNFSISPGESIAIVGRTGAGKTTITGLLARFYDPTAGKITVDGHDIKYVTRESLAHQIGMVLQEPFLFSGSIRENIRYSKDDATDEQVEIAAKAVGAHDFIQQLTHTYDSIVEERGGNLSIGQRQLISFARAIVADPRIIILDEATANIDTKTELLIQHATKSILKGRTSIVIAHRLSTVRYADRIIVVDQGSIAEIGTHSELIAKNGIYANHYTLHQGFDRVIPGDPR
jgi:ATP-binding cassette subfamily B multidrug efflux pump